MFLSADLESVLNQVTLIAASSNVNLCILKTWTGAHYGRVLYSDGAPTPGVQVSRASVVATRRRPAHRTSLLKYIYALPNRKKSVSH